MFRAIILPIFRNTSLCVTACGIMHRRCCRLPALYQWCTVKQISHNETYLLIKYIKSVIWRVAKRLSYIKDARGLKVKFHIWDMRQKLLIHSDFPYNCKNIAFYVKLHLRASGCCNADCRGWSMSNNCPFKPLAPYDSSQWNTSPLTI